MTTTKAKSSSMLATIASLASSLALLLVLLFLSLTTTATLADAQATDRRVNYTATTVAGLGTPLTIPSSATTYQVTLGDDVLTPASIGFTFNFYGVNYTSLQISTNGNLQFETADWSWTPTALPSSAASIVQPFIGFFYCDMVWTSGTAIYTTLGTAPSRVWLLRVRNVVLYAYAGLYSFDVELYEGTNAIVVRYYNTPYSASASVYLQVGVSGKAHADFSTEFTVLPGLNAALWAAAPVAALNYTTLTFTPSPAIPYVSSVPAPTPVASGTYGAQVIANTGPQAAIPTANSVALTGSADGVFTIDLGFSFWFYGANFTRVALNTNGVLQFSTLSSTPYPDTLPTSSSTQLPFIAFAYANWNPTVSGMITYMIDGPIGAKYLRIRYNNVPHYDRPTAYITCDVFLYQSNSSVEVRYTAVPRTDVYMAVGIQSASRISPTTFDYAVVVNNVLLADSVSTGLTNATVRFLVVNASVAQAALAPVPVSFNSTLLQSVVPRTPLVGAQLIEASNDNTDYLAFGFGFWWAGNVYSGAYLTTNGELQFSTSVALYQSGTLVPSLTRAPLLAFFYTDLFPLLNAERSYATTGTAPNRVFTLRHDNVPYASTAAALSAPSVSVDVLLFEVDYHVEVRYYNVSAATAQSVTVAAQGSTLVRADGTFDVVTLANNLPIATTASTLNGSTWVIRQTTNTTRLSSFGLSYSITRPIATPARIPLPTTTTYYALTISSSIIWIISFDFAFSFYNTSYMQVYASPYGYLQFGTYYFGYNYPSLWPTGGLGLAPVLAIFNTDFNVNSVATSPTWYTFTIGTAPYRSLVLQYRNFLPVWASDQSMFNADLLLNETTNIIEVRYYDIPTSITWPVTIGVMARGTARVDGSYDLTMYANAVLAGSEMRDDLRANTLAFVPAPPGSVPPPPISDSYNVTAVQLSSSTPPTLYNVVYLSPYDDSSVAIPLGFLFLFYAERYSFVTVSSEGLLQFLATSTLVTPSQFPLTNSLTVPALAYFWTPLYVNSSQSMGYTTSGAYPNRVFTLRLTNVQYATERQNATTGTVSLDVQLFEFDSHIAVSYYSVSTSAQSVLIGIQGSVQRRADQTYDYTTWVNLVPLAASVVNTLRSQRLEFWPTDFIPAPSPLTPLTPTWYGSYNASHSLGVVAPVALPSPVYPTMVANAVLSGIPLNFSFTFYGVAYTTVRLSSNGNLQFATSSVAAAATVVPSGSTGLEPYIGFAFLNLYPTTGQVAYQTLGAAPSRYFVLRFNSVSYWGQPMSISCDVVLYETSNAIELRYYAVYPVVGMPTTIAIENARASTTSINQYAAVLNFKYIDSTTAARLSFSTVRFQVNPNRFLNSTYQVTRSSSIANTTAVPDLWTQIEGSNDNIDTVAIGFAFVFYGTSYSTLQISSNGDLQFSTAYAAYVPRMMPYQSSLTSPYLAYFYTDLYPMADTAKRYGNGGFYPNRFFALRLTNVPYTSSRTQSNAPAVSIDVVLFEVDYRIEVRYYRVDVSTQTVNIGTEGSTAIREDGYDDFSIYLNQVAVGPSVASTLQGATLTFAPITPFTRPSVLYASSYNYSVTTMTTGPENIAAASPTSVSLTDDSVTGALSIGFPFNFYDTNYTTVRIGSNGNLQFVTASTSYSPASMPTGNSGVLPAVMFAFVDLNAGMSGAISYATLGTAPNRYFFVRFANVSYYGSFAATQDVWVDILLYEQAGQIRLRYYTLQASYAPVTIGVQASASPRVDGSYDYVSILNYAYVPSGSSIVGKEYYFWRNTGAVGVANPTAVPLTYNETFVTADTRVTNLLLADTYPWSAAVAGVHVVRSAFPVNFFGTTYSLLQVSQNGVITFGAQVPPTANSAMPVLIATSLPQFAFFFTSLLPLPNAVLVTQSSGTYPNRVFLVRFDGMRYANTTSTTTASVSADVRFFENTGAISISYYAVVQSVQSVQTVLIGLQASATRRSDYTYDFLSTLNQGTVDPDTVTMLLNRAVVFTPIAPIAPPVNLLPPTLVSPGTYNVTFVQRVSLPRETLTAPSTTGLPTGDDAVASIPLTFVFRFYGSSYSSIVVSTNGNIQFATSSTSYIPSTLPSTTTGLSPFIAVFWADMYADAGTLQYQVLGSAPNRYFVLRYNALRALASTAITVDVDTLLYETTNAIVIRYYRMSPHTGNVQIGIQGTSLLEYATLWNAQVFGDAGVNGLSYSTLTIAPVTTFVSATGNWYNATVARGALTSTVPPPLGSGAVTIPGSNDNIDTIPIGFAFRFYRGIYTSLGLSSNGDIQFATAFSTYTASRTIPSRDGSIVPYLAFFYTDLYPISNTAKSYVTSGAAPYRTLTIRYDSVPYVTTFFTTPVRAVTIDVVLFEFNSSIQVRYYRVDPSNQTVLVGVEGNLPLRSDFSTDATPVYNQVSLTSDFAASLQGSVVTFVNTNVTAGVNIPTVPPPAYLWTNVRSVPSRVVMANPTSLAGTNDDVTPNIPLGFNFTFYGVSYSTVNVGGNGNVQFTTTNPSYAPLPFSSGSGGLAPFIAFAFSDLYSIGYGTRTYATMGTAPSRYWLLRYDGVVFLYNALPLSVDLLLNETSNAIEIRYYAMSTSTVYTNFQVGVAGSSTARVDGSYDAVFVWDAAVLAGTDVDEFISNTYVFVPNAAGTQQLLPATYAVSTANSVPTRVVTPATASRLTVSDDYVDYAPVGFAFTFYESVFNTLRVSTNGAIEFTSVAAAYTNAPMPSGNTALLPVFAFFYTNLYATVSGMITYWTTGTTPNQVFTLRFDAVPYYDTRNNATGPTVSLDVLLYEVNSTWEVRYYNVQACPTQSVVIGVQQDTIRRSDFTIDYTPYLNAAFLYPSVTNSLSNTTVWFAQRTAVPPVTISPLPSVNGTNAFYVGVHTRAVSTRAVLSAPASIAGGDDSLYTVPIGFQFPFYGTNYTSLVFSTNGYLQFATSYNSYVSTSLPTDTAVVPILAYFWVDLNSASVGTQQYQVLGTAPLRTFVLRVSGVPLFASTTSFVSVDVVLAETTGIIEFRYYDVPLTTSSVLIGTQGPVASTATTNWTAVVNYLPISNSLAFALGGSTYTLTPRALYVPPMAVPSSSVPVPSSSVAPSSSVVPSSSVIRSSSVPVPSSSVPVPSSSVPLASSSVPLPPSSVPVPSSSVARSSSVPVAVPSSSAGGGGVAVDPLGCVVPTTLSSTVQVARVRIVLRFSYASLLQQTYAAQFIPQLLGLIINALNPTQTTLYCGGYEGAGTTRTLSVLQTSSDTLTVGVIVQGANSSASVLVANQIATAASDSSSSLYTTPSSSSFSFSSVVSANSQPASGSAVSTGCVSASGTFGTCPDASSSSSGLSGGAIAGVVIGVIAGVVLLFAAFIVLRGRSKNTSSTGGGGGSGARSARSIFSGGAGGAGDGHAQLEESRTVNSQGGVHAHDEVELTEHSQVGGGEAGTAGAAGGDEEAEVEV